MNLKEIIKDNTVKFVYYRAKYLYYKIQFKNDWYIFPVPIEDCGDASFNDEDKAIYYMRYLSKAIDEKSFVILN